MTKTTSQMIARLAILTALSVVCGYFLKIPTPTGMFTLLDVGIYVAAFSLGSREGAVVGGLAGFLIDFISGYPQWMLHSLIWHGAQGYFAGFSGKKRPIGLLFAGLVMVGGYFVSSLWMYNLADALASLPTNIVQNGVGIVIGYFLMKTGVFRRELRK